MIADAPQLRAYIDEYLGSDIQTGLEDLIVAADGIGENFTGIMNGAGTQTPCRTGRAGEQPRQHAQGDKARARQRA